MHRDHPEMQEFMHFQRSFHYPHTSPKRDPRSQNTSVAKKEEPMPPTNEEVHMMLLGHTIPRHERHEVAMTDHIAKISSNFINGLAEKQLGFNKKRFFTKRDTAAMQTRVDLNLTTIPTAVDPDSFHNHHHYDFGIAKK